MATFLPPTRLGAPVAREKAFYEPPRLEHFPSEMVLAP